MMRDFRIAVLAGDGIGQEVMAPCLTLLEAVTSATGVGLRLDLYEAVPSFTLEPALRCLPTCCTPRPRPTPSSSAPWDIPTSATRTAPRSFLRSTFAIISSSTRASGRSARSLACERRLRTPARATSILWSFENPRRGSSPRGMKADATAMQPSSTPCASPAAAASACSSRRSRSPVVAAGGGLACEVTCVDKANVLPSMAFFREIFLECASRYPDVATDCIYVDAAALRFVKAPWDLDVVVTENMFGDILSDLGAGLIGGMGMAPSADIGERQAVFQPCHGTAPDIAGRGLANPTAMFLSAAMMLDWLGERHDDSACQAAAARLTRAVERAFADGTLVPTEHGGSAGTAAIAERVASAL